MNIFEYVPLMKDINNQYSKAGIIILIVFLVFIILRMLSGMGRGIFRQLLRTGLTVGSAVLAFITADLVGNEILSTVDIGTVDGIMDYLRMVEPQLASKIGDILNAFPTESIAKIMLLPAAVVILPTVFLSIFLLVKVIAGILCALLYRIFKFKKATDNVQRFGGALLGAVEAIIYITVILIPFTGIVGVMGESYDSAIYSDDGLDADAAFEYTTTYLPITENPAIKLVSDLGGDAISNHFATVKIGDKASNLREELVPVIKFYLIDCRNGSIDFRNLGEGGKDAISKFLTAMESSPCLSDIVCCVVRGGSFLLENGGILELGDVPSDLTDALFAFLGGFSTEYFTEDINTLRDIYFALSDHGILAAMVEGDTDIMTLLGENHQDGSSAVSSIVTVLQSNPRTAPLVRAITDLLLSNLVTPDVDGAPKVDYDELKSDVEKVLDVKEENYASEKEYKEALGNVLDGTLKNHGIELEEEIVDGIAEYVADNFSQVDELTDEEFNSILLHYYEAYQEYLNSGDIPDDFKDFIN